MSLFHNLVGALEHEFDFSIQLGIIIPAAYHVSEELKPPTSIGNVIIPTVEVHHFSDGLVYHQPDEVYFRGIIPKMAHRNRWFTLW